MSVFRAAFEAGNGSEFEAFGETPEQASAYLLDAMSRYGAETGKKSDWWKDEDDLGLVVTEIELGVGYRDGLVYNRPLPR